MLKFSTAASMLVLTASTLLISPDANAQNGNRRFRFQSSHGQHFQNQNQQNRQFKANQGFPQNQPRTVFFAPNPQRPGTQRFAPNPQQPGTQRFAPNGQQQTFPQNIPQQPIFVPQQGCRSLNNQGGICPSLNQPQVCPFTGQVLNSQPLPINQLPQQPIPQQPLPEDQYDPQPPVPEELPLNPDPQDNIEPPVPGEEETLPGNPPVTNPGEVSTDPGANRVDV